MPQTTVDVYVDYVCPFCLLVKPALDELARERDVDIRIRPFELRPDPVPTLRPEDEYLPRVWRDSVYPMAERVGIPIRLPSVSPQPRTQKAFLVLQLADEAGLAAQYSNAMLRAFFQDDLDIGDERVITDVATGIGLDEQSVLQAFSDPDRIRQHQADLAHAVETVGVTSVPGIVVGGTVLAGVPSATRLKQAVDAMQPSADDRS